MAAELTVEVFAANHAELSDASLLERPAQPVSPLNLFVCTYVARLSNIHMDGEELTKRLSLAPRGSLLAVNSNYGHACQAGFESLMKLPAAVARPVLRGRPRKGQGDTTCFNSAVEPIMRLLAFPDSDKVYKMKLFSTTGETQVPGVLNADLSDGHAALTTLVDYLNATGAGDFADGTAPPRWSQLRKAAEEAAAAGDATAIPRYQQQLTAYVTAPQAPNTRLLIEIATEGPKMLNYKFRINRSSPRMLVNLVTLSTYLSTLEAAPIGTTPVALAGMLAGNLPGQSPVYVQPPFPVRETNPPTDDVKVSFRFRSGHRAPRVNVFQGGKINILGAESIECAARIYSFFQELFTANWNELICLQPRRDAVAPARQPRPRRDARARQDTQVAAPLQRSAAQNRQAAAVAPSPTAEAPAALRSDVELERALSYFGFDC